MNIWKQRLIDSYRIASTPLRAMQMRKRRRLGKVPVYVLFFHRVADCHSNDWSMTCDQFEQQIDWYEKNFQIVDLEECQRRIRSGFNTQPTLAITFDDGYAENCEFALPMLIERRIPVTYFVTTDHTTNQKPFPHDVESGEPLPVNTIESLRALDMSGIEIGAHTRTHVNLATVDDVDQIYDEVIASARELENEIGRKMRYFAFPYGRAEHLNAEVFRLLKREGFLGAVTTYSGWNEIGDDDFQLSRLHGDPSFARMRNWLSYDPRLGNVEKFPYELDEANHTRTNDPAPQPVFPVGVGQVPAYPNNTVQ